MEPKSPSNSLFESLPVSPDSNSGSSSKLLFPLVGAAEVHTHVTRTDNARLEDFDINLHIPLPSLFQKEQEVIPIGQTSESASTTSKAYHVSTPYQSPDISIAESAHITPSTHASDQVNTAFVPYPVECIEISSDSDISTQSNQSIVYFSPVSAHHTEEYSCKEMLIECLRNGEQLPAVEIFKKVEEKHPDITNTLSLRNDLRKALTDSTDVNTPFEITPLFFLNLWKEPLWRMKESARKQLVPPLEVNNEKIKYTSTQPLQLTLPRIELCLPPISKGNEPSQTAQSSESASTTFGTPPLAYSSAIPRHYAKKYTYQYMIIKIIKNKGPLTMQEIVREIQKERPEIKKYYPISKQVCRVLTTKNSVFEKVPRQPMYNLKKPIWRLKESAKIEVQLTPPEIKSFLPPKSEGNESSQTAQSSESASTIFGTSLLSTPLKKHDISIAKSAQVTPSPHTSDQVKPESSPYQVEYQDISSHSDTSIQSQETIIYSSDVSVHSLEYTRKNLIIECLQHGEALSFIEIFERINKNHPEIEKLGLSPAEWKQSVHNNLLHTSDFEIVNNRRYRTTKALWHIKKSVLENMPYPVMVNPEEATSTNKNTKSPDFILPHRKSEHESITSTIKPQTTQLSELKFNDQPIKEWLRNIAQDGATLDSQGEQQAKEQRIQTLTPESSSATGCLDDEEKMTHKEQPYDQNIDDSYWTAERTEELQFAWDTIVEMEGLLKK